MNALLGALWVGQIKDWLERNEVEITGEATTSGMIVMRHPDGGEVSVPVYDGDTGEELSKRVTTAVNCQTGAPWVAMRGPR